MVFGAGMMMLEETWALSVMLLPYLFLAALVVSFYLHRHAHIATVIHSQQRLVSQYGTIITLGLVSGGIMNYGTGMSGLVSLGTVVAIAVSAYSFKTDALPHPRELDLGHWTTYLQGVWVIVPLASLAGIVLGHQLIMHVVAVTFYGVLFWRL